jgi:hypothetical protein
MDAPQLLDNVQRLARHRLPEYIYEVQKDCPERYRVFHEVGRKYYKVLLDTGVQKLVHSFVDKQSGDLHKAASYNSPVRPARFNLFADWEVLKERIDWSGSYLYLR